jgi:hypothetical protein
VNGMLGEAIAILSRTPATLRALLGGLPEPLLASREGEGAFSPLDVLGHLIHGEQTDWIPRTRLILSGGESKPFEPFDPHGFRAAVQGRSAGALLAEFESLRAENLDVLRGLALAPAELSLRGRHPALGPVTLGQLIATWAVHDLSHVSQVVRAISRRYADAVGPWRAYLRILNA